VVEDAGHEEQRALVQRVAERKTTAAFTAYSVPRPSRKVMMPSAETVE
jgi:hypothetical protein